jgi:glycosyltransferase involved in cell wall biosynthesis
VAGDGPARGVAEAAARGLPCVRWLGAQRGVEKATLLAACDFMLLPGAVGLAIVDAFAAGLPLLATRAPGHGPEIAYLEPGRNGDLTAPDPAAYAAAVTRLLQQPEVLQQWRRQARADGQRYTLEGMVERFGQGILAALGRPRL